VLLKIADELTGVTALVTLEFATISGIRLGFGFNSVVRSPRIDELTDFPFIKTTVTPGASDTPMAILKAMTPMWVTPKENSYWVRSSPLVLQHARKDLLTLDDFVFRLVIARCRHDSVVV
jgi:hypothetical protein